MSFRSYLLAGLLLLSGCAPTLAAVNEQGGIIGNHGWSSSQSFNVAEAACQRYGKHAVVTGTNDLEATMTFQCVK